MYVGRVLPATHAMEALSAEAYGLAPSMDPLLSVLVIAGIGILVSVLVGVRFTRINRMR
jgi:hypothetical protein